MKTKIFLLLIALTPLILPLLRPGFFVSDDGEWMIIRLAAFHQTLLRGEFPVRYLYSLNHGYAYPVTNFLYPLPFYLGEIIHRFGFNFTDSVKILFASGFLFSALGMYYLVERKWGKWAGFISALAYTYAPYRIFDVYHRGSLGEAVAFIFVPFIFYFLDTNIILASVAYTALICSHNTLAFMFTPLIFLYTLWKLYSSPEKFVVIKQVSLFLLLSYSLSAFFWFPALYDLQFTRAPITQVANFKDYFLSGQNFLALVGILPPLSLLLAFFNIPLGLITAISLFLSSSFSTIIWQHTPLPQLVQFPWRFLSVTVFVSAILLGFASSKIRRPILFPLLALTIILLSLPSIKIIPTDKSDDYYSTNDATTTVKNEYMPKWVKNDPAVAPEKKYTYLNSTTIRLNQVYFPGLKVYVDNQEVAYDYQASGLPEFSFPPGFHTISARFTETPIRLAADTITLLSILLVCYLLFPRK